MTAATRRAVLPLSGEPWTRDDAIRVMCRSLARLLDEWGQEGDADAVRYAESVLLRPQLSEVTAIVEENERLRRRIAELEAVAAEWNAKVRAHA